MRDDLARETEKLSDSWSRHEARWLREYLVAGVEDPRLNIQSIVSRHFLIRALFEDPPEELMAREYGFAATLNWLMQTRELFDEPEARVAALHALRLGADNAEGLALPAFVRRTFRALPLGVSGSTIPNYLELFLTGQPGVGTLNQLLETFAGIWKRLLPRLRTRSRVQPGDGRFLPDELTTEARVPSVVEPACGSANDFRFLHSYGLAPLLEYTGFDLCSKNVANARELFPGTRFEEGNVFEITARDKSFDLCVVHDLFEHLSLPGLEQAVREVCRVTREALCLGFFQMDDIPEHQVRPTDQYHWNLLAVGRMKQLFVKQGFAVQVIHIDSFLSQQTGGAQSHNPNAYTFLVRRA